MKKMPDDVRDRMKKLIWARAEELGWSDLNDAERSKYYEQWTTEKELGGKLAHYMDPRRVRVYIKDSLLKPYERARLSGTEAQILSSLGISPGIEIEQRYIKPHGIRFADGRVVSWGNSRDWKSVIMAMFERAMLAPGSRPFGMALVESGKTAEPKMRKLVKAAARKLDIEKLEWID